MRLSAILAACASLAILAVAATASADQQPTVTGGCHVDVNAQVKPGLTLASHPFQFAYQGQLSSCYYTGTGAAHGGAISAGRQITIDGRRYQEPVPTGSGSCLVTSAAGYDFAFWNNGTQTIVKYQTTSAAGVTHLTGMVWPRLTLPAVDPKPGDPKSITFKTTNFNGQTVFGVMQFTADPRLCNTSQGVEAATISGQLGHYGPQTSSTAPDLNCSTTTQGEVCTTQRYTAPAPARPAAKPGRRRCSTKNRSQRTPQRCTARRHKQNRGTHGQGAAQPTSSSAAPMGLTSSAFANGGSLPRRYTCLGKLISPPLAWTNVPARTRELELLVTDAARNNLSHWVLYAIPPADTGAAEAAAPPGAKQGTNGFGLQGYLPPCPFVGLDPHKYVFELFASRKPLNLPGQPTDPQVRAALEGNTLATATLTATYKFGD